MIILRKSDVKQGMILRAWTSNYGEFKIRVIGITTGKPARVIGEVLSVIVPGYRPLSVSRKWIGQTKEFGIINVFPTSDEDIRKIRSEYARLQKVYRKSKV